MVTKLKKSRKMRGKNSSGHGRINKHRKNPGGKGKSGGQHHHKIIFERYRETYFRKTGMRIYNLEKTLNSTFLLKFKDMLKINFFENLLFNSYTSVFLTLLNLSALRIKKVLGNGISDFKNALIIVNSVAKSVNKKAVQRSSVMLIIVKNIN
ncbi:ribosomal protein L27a (nucleomorph) [Bigelowiella natans]|uniref:Ribosomal protein L27a n=1 Tax=Bigelowiella natans TaxID=227086 RepID=Q3LW97_BIGNA|nr:ribosomal protein L27a [Bigelowiella natans]ABA27269.1 ribosomal protein L27a [Bigelowiella natans]|mmetsp:Transcript_12858/g.21427  ORF Transcript_12858/g.21427 Transcript_12858/m.21427 type:complete len:152 (+) Transcript_12858:459-914(+)